VPSTSPTVPLRRLCEGPRSLWRGTPFSMPDSGSSGLSAVCRAWRSIPSEQVDEGVPPAVPRHHRRRCTETGQERARPTRRRGRTRARSGVPLRRRQLGLGAFCLVADGTGTRLISRNRIATPGDSWPARAFYRYVMEPGSLVMERKMLLGIKQRAERLAERCKPASTVRCETLAGRGCDVGRSPQPRPKL
jgi:hypothetical protein